MSSATALADSRASYAATLLASFCFGFYVLLAGTTIHRQLKKAKRFKQRSHRITILYTTLMFCLASLWFITGAVYAEYISVEIPANPALQNALATCDPMAIIRVLARTLIIWMSDGMLLWRTFVMWDRSEAVTAFPFLVYLASIGLGIAFELSCLGKTMGGPISFASVVDLALPFYALSAGLTVINTSLITYKLLAHRRELRQGGLNSDDALATYTSIIYILVDSGSLYTVVGVIFVVLTSLKSPAAIAMSSLFATSAFIAPTLIQLRIVSGEAYSEESKFRTRNPNSSVTLNPIRFHSGTLQQSTLGNDSKLDDQISKLEEA